MRFLLLDMDILQYCMIAGVAVSGVAFILLVVCTVLVILRKTTAFRILLYLIAFLALVSGKLISLLKKLEFSSSSSIYEKKSVTNMQTICEGKLRFCAKFLQLFRILLTYSQLKLTSHDILHYLWSADLSKSSSQLIASTLTFLDFSIFSPFLNIFSIDLKVWGYSTLLTS